MANTETKVLIQKFNNWLNDFLHTPGSWDRVAAETIIANDIQEAKDLFASQLPSRGASEAFKPCFGSTSNELKYWFISHPDNVQVKAIVHGSGSNFAKADRAITLLDKGYNVALLSYRAHSGNPEWGKISQKAIISDVVAQIKDLMSIYPMQDIYLEGSSLGTSILAHAMDTIYSEQGLDKVFAGLLLKAAPLNMLDDTDELRFSLQTAGLNYEQIKPLLAKAWNQEDVYQRIKADEIKIVHGNCDDIVPVDAAKKIFKLLQSLNPDIPHPNIIDGEGHRLDLNEYEIY